MAYKGLACLSFVSPPTHKLTLAKTAGGALITAAVAQLEEALDAIQNTVIRTGCHDYPELQLFARVEYDDLLATGHDWKSAKMQFLSVTSAVMSRGCHWVMRTVFVVMDFIKMLRNCKKDKRRGSRHRLWCGILQYEIL